MEYLDFVWDDDPVRLQLEVKSTVNGSLLIVLHNLVDGDSNPGKYLTVVTPMICHPNCAFVDVHQMNEEYFQYLAELLHAVPTGWSVSNNYWIFPEYLFDSKVLQRLDPDGYARYLEALPTIFTSPRVAPPGTFVKS